MNKNKPMEIVCVGREASGINDHLERLGCRIHKVGDVSQAIHAASTRKLDAALIGAEDLDRARLVRQLRDTDSALQIILIDPAEQVFDQARRAQVSPTEEDRVSDVELDRLPRRACPSILRAIVRRAGQVTRLLRENEILRQSQIPLPNDVTSGNRSPKSVLPDSSLPSNPHLTDGAQAANSGWVGQAPYEEVEQVVERPMPVVGGDVDLETLNRAHVLAVLQQHQGNKAQAARALGINRRSLYRLLEKYGSRF